MLNLVVSLDEILHNAARLKKADHSAIREGVCECGNAAIWVDLEKLRLFLGVGLYIDFVDFVGEATEWGNVLSCEHLNRENRSGVFTQALQG